MGSESNLALVFLAMLSLHFTNQLVYLLMLKTKGGGGIRLIVGFQPLMVISPTASWCVCLKTKGQNHLLQMSKTTRVRS